MKQMQLKIGEGDYDVTFRHERVPVEKSRVRSLTVCTVVGRDGKLIGQGIAFRSKLDRERAGKGARIAFLRALKAAGFDKPLRKPWWDALVPKLMEGERA